VPKRPCIEARCPLLAESGKARCSVHEAQLQRAKWLKNPNRDQGYRRLKRLVVLPVPCAICGEPITQFGHDGSSHTFDHVTPWSVARNNAPSNLRHAHKRCNSSRGRGPRVA
jgi:5-methylcytosine-specific restriction endonuclease McrA